MWRRLFDAVDSDLGPRLEQLVRTDQFADGVAFVNQLNQRASEAAAEMNRQLLRFWNLPSATQVADLKKQLAAMERQLRKVTKALEEEQRRVDD
jgi:hypothetical protein